MMICNESVMCRRSRFVSRDTPVKLFRAQTSYGIKGFSEAAGREGLVS